MSSAGRAASSSGCVARPRGRETGLTGYAEQIQRSLPTGSSAMETAEHREPYESRGSRTDLGAPGGESPPGDSTSFHNWIKTWYAPLLFRPQLFLRGVRLLFGRPRHVLPPRRFPGRRRLRRHAAVHGGGGFVHPLPRPRPNPPRQPRGDHLRKLVGANLLDTQPIRRTAKKTAELGNRVDVGVLGCL